MSFFFESGTSTMIAAFAELYVVEPVGDSACRLRWSMGMEPKGMARILGPLVGFALERQCAGGLKKLETYAPSWA